MAVCVKEIFLTTLRLSCSRACGAGAHAGARKAFTPNRLSGTGAIVIACGLFAAFTQKQAYALTDALASSASERETATSADDHARWSQSIDAAAAAAAARALEGVWKQDSSRCESMLPFLSGIGVPSFAAYLVDNFISTTLDISVSISDNIDPGNAILASGASARSKGSVGEVTVTAHDTTIFGKNTTQIVLFAPEKEVATRTGRKRFKISGRVDAVAAGGAVTIQCRLFQRGEGWFTFQRWQIMADGSLKEQFILRRPEKDDVTVTRFFGPAAQRVNLQNVDLQAEDKVPSRSRHMLAAAAALGVAAVGIYYASSSPPGSSNKE